MDMEKAIETSNKLLQELKINKNIDIKNSDEFMVIHDALECFVSDLENELRRQQAIMKFNKTK